MHSLWASEKFSYQNSVIHPKFSPDVSHSQPSPPLSLQQTQENLVFSRFRLRIKSWKLLPKPPSPPPADTGIWFSADLDSGEMWM